MKVEEKVDGINIPQPRKVTLEDLNAEEHVVLKVYYCYILLLKWQLPQKPLKLQVVILV